MAAVLTPAERAALETERDALLKTRSALLLGTQVVKVKWAGKKIKYAMPVQADIETRLQDIAVALGEGGA